MQPSIGIQPYSMTEYVKHNTSNDMQILFYICIILLGESRSKKYDNELPHHKQL